MVVSYTPPVENAAGRHRLSALVKGETALESEEDVSNDADSAETPAKEQVTDEEYNVNNVGV